MQPLRRVWFPKGGILPWGGARFALALTSGLVLAKSVLYVRGRGPSQSQQGNVWYTPTSMAGGDEA